MNEAFVKFYLQHEEEVDRFLTEVDFNKQAIAEKAKQVALKLNGQFEGLETKIWKNRTLYCNFEVDNKTTLSVDSEFTLSGVKITVWYRKGTGGKQAKLKALKLFGSDQLHEEGERLVVKSPGDLPVLSTSDEITTAIKKVYNEVLKTIGG